MYEWFGLNFFCRPEMVEFLRGFEDRCGEDYEAAKFYIGFGFAMLFTTIFIYAQQYHILDRFTSRFSGPKWWWVFAGSAASLNFAIAFLVLRNYLDGTHEMDCINEFAEEIFNQSDLLLFALNNAIWSFIVYIAISCPPIFRRFSRNCYSTTMFRQ
jgi:hypothetical protein